MRTLSSHENISLPPWLQCAIRKRWYPALKARLPAAAGHPKPAPPSSVPRAHVASHGAAARIPTPATGPVHTSGPSCPALTPHAIPADVRTANAHASQPMVHAWPQGAQQQCAPHATPAFATGAARCHAIPDPATPAMGTAGWPPAQQHAARPSLAHTMGTPAYPLQPSAGAAHGHRCPGPSPLMAAAAGSVSAAPVWAARPYSTPPPVYSSARPPAGSVPGPPGLRPHHPTQYSAQHLQPCANSHYAHPGHLPATPSAYAHPGAFPGAPAIRSGTPMICTGSSGQFVGGPGAPRRHAAPQQPAWHAEMRTPPTCAPYQPHSAARPHAPSPAHCPATERPAYSYERTGADAQRMLGAPGLSAPSGPAAGMRPVPAYEHAAAGPVYNIPNNAAGPIPPGIPPGSTYVLRGTHAGSNPAAPHNVPASADNDRSGTSAPQRPYGAAISCSGGAAFARPTAQQPQAAQRAQQASSAGASAGAGAAGPQAVPSRQHAPGSGIAAAEQRAAVELKRQNKHWLLADAATAAAPRKGKGLAAPSADGRRFQPAEPAAGPLGRGTGVRAVGQLEAAPADAFHTASQGVQEAHAAVGTGRAGPVADPALAGACV